MPNYIDTLSPQMKKAIEHNVPLIDVMQGELKNIMYEWQHKKFENEQWAIGYLDAIEDIYNMCYDVIFYQSDMEHAK